MPSEEISWQTDIAEDPGGTTAWLLSLGEARFPLDPTRQDLLDVGLRRGDVAIRFLHRRSLLRGLVARRCSVPPASVEIGYDANGRPTILSPPRSLFCSVSARGELAALALSPHPVGIDLEPLVPGEVPWAVFAPDEAAAIRARPAAEQLKAALRLWTVKEAFLKARGSGLLSDPATVTVISDTLRAGDTTIPLHATNVLRTTLGEQPVVAACIVLAAVGGAGRQSST